MIKIFDKPKKPIDMEKRRKTNKIILSVFFILLFLILIFSFTVGPSEDRMVSAAGENITFCGADTPIGTDNFNFLVYDENGTQYYMHFNDGCLVAKVDINTAEVAEWYLKERGSEAYEFKKAYSDLISEPDIDPDKAQFSYERDGNFKFTYREGEVLGQKQRIVDKVYYPNGTEIKDSDHYTYEFAINNNTTD